MRKLISGWVIALSLGAGMVMAAGQSGAKEEAKKAGQAAKEAAKDAGDAAKHVGKATTKATKNGAKKVKRAITGKAGKAHATCVDGTRRTGKTKTAAAAKCAGHGGVARK